MKLSATIASAALAATLLVTATAASAVATVTETYDYSNNDAAFLHVTNNGAATTISISGGYAGGNSTFLNVAKGATVDFYLGDNEANFAGSQGTALVTVGGQSKSFTDVLGDPDQSIGPVTLGTVGGVPEPTSWVMLLTGFGLLGGAMRAMRSARTKAVVA